MKKIDLIIFDFDGTLVSSGGDLANSVNYTLKKLHLPSLDHSKIINFIGDGVHKLIERSLGAECPDRFADALHIFTEYYQKHMFDTTALYPGVEIVLNHFRHKHKIIMTNKLHQYTLKIAYHLKIDAFFEEIIGADSTGYKKPDSQLLLPLLLKYHVDNDKAVVVGDGVNDVLLAKNTGILSCAFLNGLTPRETLLNLQPDFICEELLRLTSLFN